MSYWFRQPNGLLGRWSSNTDGITHWNCTIEDAYLSDREHGSPGSAMEHVRCGLVDGETDRMTFEGRPAGDGLARWKAVCMDVRDEPVGLYDAAGNRSEESREVFFARMEDPNVFGHRTPWPPPIEWRSRILTSLPSEEALAAFKDHVTPGHMRWFGASWDAPVCDPLFAVDVPVGELCFGCVAPIAAGDQGFALWHDGPARAPYHRVCFMRCLGLDKNV